MATCDVLRPLLSRWNEGEASPDQALRVARHLTDCTACRIFLAREQRLAAMLSRGLHDHIPVGEAFVRSVMAGLPQGPPTAPRRNRRGLRLAAS